MAVGDYGLTMSTSSSCIAIASIISALKIYWKGHIDQIVLEEFCKKAAIRMLMKNSKVMSLTEIQKKLEQMCPFSHKTGSGNYFWWGKPEEDTFSQKRSKAEISSNTTASSPVSVTECST